MNVIEQLDNENYKNILIMRYLETLTWEDIADKMYCSCSTIKRWHKNALIYIKIEEKIV